MRPALHALPLLLSAAVASAQPPGIMPTVDPYEIESWTIRGGLPQNDVSSLVQTDDGRLWIGTYGGLARFDGTRFEIFDLSTDLELRSNRLTALCETSDGALWIGTDGEGLVRRKDGNYTSFTGLPDGQVSCLFEDARGRLWIGTGRGLAWLDGDRIQLVPDLTKPIRGIDQSPSGALWIVASDCLLKLGDGGIPEKLADGPYLSVLAASDGCVWVGKENGGIETFGNPEVPRTLELPGGGDIGAIAEDRDGGIWFGSTEHPVRWYLSRFEDPCHRDAYPLPPHVATHAALFDREGNIWFGGPGGLQRMRPTPFTGVRLPQDHAIPARTLLADQEGRLWVGLQDGTLLVYVDNQFTTMTGDASPSATAMALATDGAVWAISGDSLWRIRDGGASVEPIDIELPSTNNLAILEDRGGDLWIGSGHHLLRRSPDGAVQTEATGLGDHDIRALLESRHGDLWIGSAGGLARIRGAAHTTWACDGVELPAGIVRALYEDPHGNMWVGTYGGGMCRVAPDGTTNIVGTAQGLHEGVVTRIAECELGQVVLQGNRALSVLSIESLNEVADGAQSRVYPRVFEEGPGIGVYEGMGGSTPLVCRLDGSLWFPALQSLVRFDPSALAPVITPPRPIIESVEVDGLSYEEDDRFRPRFTRSGDKASFVIPPGTHNLAIRFTAPTFVDSERTRFRYRLDGYDEDWIDAKDRAAIYTHVPAGPFRFSVMAAHPGGDWSPQPTAISLEFQPWWYQTPWVQAALAILLIAIVAGSLFSRSRRLRRHAEELAALVAVRTSELEREIVVRRGAEERLREARDQLEYKRETLEHELRDAQKFEALGHLAGKLAHDFNNILTAIMGQSDLVLAALGEADSGHDPRREGLTTIKSASERAARLVQQLLAYSRQQILQPQTIDPNGTIRDFEEILRRLIREDIELRMRLMPNVGWIYVDPGQLEQVIMNLVVNASDASSRGQVTIETAKASVDAGFIEIHPEATVGPHITIAVSDTGSGMGEQTIDRIFDPFFTTKVHGTGLGLASVHGIVAQSGGFIRVSSTPDAGSTFTVYLPEVDPPTAADLPVAPAKQARTGNATVLLCDDEPSIRKVASRVLENSGYRVLIAENPHRALELGQSHANSIDLLITDLVMPEMHGTDLANHLRDVRKGLKVLYISGYSPEIATEDNEDAATHFLHKPFNADTLIRQVEEVLAESPK